MEENELWAQILSVVAGGFLSLVSASLAAHFGYRSADRLPGEGRLPECVFCYRRLQWFEYFPLFGWLFRRHPFKLPCPCGKRTGLWPVPLAELCGFILGAAAVFLVGWSPVLWPLCLGLGLLPAIALVDLSFGIIPDGLNILLGLCGLAWLLLGHADIYMNLIGASGLLGLGLFLALGYSKWRGREMLGLGDVKFFAAAGLWLSLIVVPWFLMAAGIIGAVLGLIWRRLDGSKEFPFAPALCLSLTGCIFYQLYILYWVNAQ